MTTEYPGNIRSRLPASTTADLSGLVQAMAVMTRAGHKKLTAQQMLFFFAVAFSNVKRQSINIADVRAIYGELGRSVEKTIVNFLAPTDRFPDALDWLRQVEDPDDRRKKYLELTPVGAEVIEDVIEALRGR